MLAVTRLTRMRSFFTGRRREIPPLPADLIRPIIQNLQGDLKVLYALSLCSRLFHKEANVFLYKSFTKQGESELTLKRFLESVIANPELAAHVHTIHLYLTVKWSDPSRANFVNFVALIILGVQKLHNLTELGIYAERDVLYAATLLAHVPPSVTLRTFLWSSYVIVPYDDTKVLEFIKHHESLTRLRWILHEDSQIVNTFPLSACPDLFIFEGNRPAIEAVLPSRRVRRLVWLNDQSTHSTAPFHVSHRLRNALQNLQSITYKPYEPHIIRHDMDLLGCLCNIEMLEICEYRDEMLLPLSQFPRLAVLVFTIETEPRRGYHQLYRAQQSRFIKPFFKVCNVLQRVDISTNYSEFPGLLEDKRRATYWRWERGSRRGRFVLWETVQLDILTHRL